MEQSVALVVAPQSRPLTGGGCAFMQDGFYIDRAPRSLWRDFTPHRLIRRYSDYAWLNKPVPPSLAS
jgi:hypothetical protein